MEEDIEVYLQVNMTDLAKTATDSVGMLNYLSQLLRSGNIDRTTFLSAYNELTFTTSSQIANCLKIFRDLYKLGNLTRTDFVNAYDKYHMTWANAGWEYIEVISECYYDGTLSLAEVKNYWSFGDTKTMSIASSSSYSAQTVNVKIVDFNHMPLVGTKGGKSNAFITLAFVLSANGSNVGTQAAGWEGSAVRTSMNSDLINSFPTTLKEIVKEVNKQSDNGSNDSIQLVTTQDRVFIPTAIEFTGGNSVSIPHASTSSGYTQIGSGGTQFDGYKTASLRNYGKTIWTVTSIKYYSIYDYNKHYELMETINTSGNRGYANRSSSLGLVPHFCI